MTRQVLLAIPFLLGQGSASGELERVIAAVTTAREKVADYHLIVKAVTTIGEASAENSVRAVRYEVWRSGPRLRTDAVVNQKGGGETPVTDRREVVCRDCDRRGYRTMFMQMEKGRSHVTYSKLDVADGADDTNLDWRYLGVLNAEARSLLTKRYDASLRGIQKQPTLAVGREARDGVEHVVFSATYANGGTIRCLVRPDRDFNPVEYAVRVPLGKQADKFLVQTTKIVHKRDGPTGVWFPADIRHHRTSDGQLVLDEVVTVESADLHRPVPADVFELAAMRLRPNTRIAVPGVTDPDKYPVWHDGTVDPTRTAGQVQRELREKMQPPPVPDQPEPGVRDRWPYWVAGGVFTVVALWLIARTVRQRA